MNLWEIAHWQEDSHEQSLSLLWSHRKLSGLIKEDEEVGNKMIPIKWNSTED